MLLGTATLRFQSNLILLILLHAVISTVVGTDTADLSSCQVGNGGEQHGRLAHALLVGTVVFLAVVLLVALRQ